MKLFSKNVPVKFIWAAIFSLIALIVASWLYFIVVPHHVDKEAFRLTKVSYKSDSVLYKYAESDVVAGVYIKVSSDDAARMLKENPPTLTGCGEIADVQCVPVWVPASRHTPQRYGPDDTHNTSLYKQVMGGDSMCSYAVRSNEDLDGVDAIVDGFLRSRPFIKDVLCVNPKNGYVMYTKIRT